MLDIHAACADNELISHDGNQFVVRLLLASDDMDINHTDHEDSNESGHGKRKLNYIPAGKKTAYLSTMKRIMKLRSAVEDNNDLKEKLGLQFRDRFGNPQKIPWNAFYFEADEKGYADLLHYIEKNKVYHPLCVEGYIKSVTKYDEGKYCLKLEPIKRNIKERIAIDIYFHADIIMEHLNGMEEKRIVVYSTYTLKKKPWRTPDGTIIEYNNITGSIYDNNQLYIIED